MDTERRQTVAHPVPLVGDESLHGGFLQPGRVVPATRCVGFEVGTELDEAATQRIDRARGRRGVRCLQDVGEIVPQQVPQPHLADSAQVEVAAAVGVPDAEVFGFEESCGAGIGPGEVHQAQLAERLQGDVLAVRSLAVVEDLEVEIDQ